MELFNFDGLLYLYDVMNNYNKYYVYQLINPIDKKAFYVGKGCGNRLYKHEKDVRLGKIPNKTNYDLYNTIKSIIESGHQIIYEKIEENLCEIDSLSLESAFIEYYGIDNLCNYLRSWSGSMFRSEKTRRRQSAANKGEKSYMFGKKKTEEQKLKNRLAHIGENNVRYINKIFKFYNFKLNSVEECTPYQLRMKYKLDSAAIHRLIKNKRYSVNGWSLGKSADEIESIRRKKISDTKKFRDRMKVKIDNI